MPIKNNSNENANDVDNQEELDNLDNNSEDNSSDEKDNSNSSEKSSKSSEKKFTQAQVTKMMAKEKNQGRNSVYNELGIKPDDKDAIAAFKAFMESQKSDDLKASEREAANQSKIEEAETRAKIAEARAEAMMMGAKTQYVEDLVTLSMQKILSDDSADLKTIIGEYKTKYPVWFGEDSEEEDSKKSGQRGTGSSPSSKSKGSRTDADKGLGQRLAAQRRGKTGKSSFWGAKK